jgi:Fe-Mn family superoxide dismutase
MLEKKLDGKFVLPDLPFARNELEPHISENTINYHYGKHHQKYVDTLNDLIAGSDLEQKGLEEIIKKSAGDSSKVAIFNNAAQVWNHSFFWACMKKGGGGKPSGELLQQIEKDFGDFDSFVAEFKQAAATQFGSGWAWLVWDGSKLSIMKTANADLPMAHNKKAILTIDVWEHAYYLDYQNKRPDYIGIFLEKLVNWDFALQNLQTQL